VEGGLRLWVSGMDAAERPRWAQGERFDPDNWSFSPHHYLNYRPRPGYAVPGSPNRHNGQGLRQAGPVPVPKPEGEYRIVAVGGSTTYGVGTTDWRDTYPMQLQAALREAGKARVRVVNAGVPGYNSWETLINVAYRVLPLEPDLIVVYHATNDVHARLVPPALYKADNSGRRRQWDDSDVRYWAYEMPSMVWRLVGTRAGWLHPPSVDDVVTNPAAAGHPKHNNVHPALGMTPLQALKRNPPTHFARNIRNIVAMARANGARVLLLTFAFNPERGRQNNHYSGSEHYAFGIGQHNDVMRRIAAERDTLFLDFARRMPRDPALWAPDGIHFGKAGNRRFAALVADHLLQQDVIPAAR